MFFMFSNVFKYLLMFLTKDQKMHPVTSLETFRYPLALLDLG